MNPNPLHHPQYAALVDLLKQARKDAGITQVELARRLGVEQTLISKVERLERRIDPAELCNVCQALNISFVEFCSKYETKLKAGQSLKNTSFKYQNPT